MIFIILYNIISIVNVPLAPQKAKEEQLSPGKIHIWSNFLHCLLKGSENKTRKEQFQELQNVLCDETYVEEDSQEAPVS